MHGTADEEVEEMLTAPPRHAPPPAIREVGKQSAVLPRVRILGSGPAVDIRIEDGLIREVRPSASSESRLVVLPALVDLHTHLREPGGEVSETIASGTLAALRGGFADVFAMANTLPVTDRVSRVHDIRERARAASVRVHPVSAATIELAGQALVDVEALRIAGVMLFSDDGRCVTDDGVVLELLSRLATAGGVFAQHAQSGSIVGDGVIDAVVADQVACAPWPTVGEEAVVARDVAIARATGGRLHVCHVSSGRTVDILRWAKSVGAPVTAEVTPHHLMLTNVDAVEGGPSFKVNPPLRSRDDIDALRSALRDGTIDSVGTDHAPHAPRLKEGDWTSAAFGYTGIETALSVTATAMERNGEVDWTLLADRMCTRPARIGGLQVRSVEVGQPAELCVVEEGSDWLVAPETFASASRNSPIMGRHLRHRIVEILTCNE